MSLRTSLLRTANIVRSLASPSTLSGGQGLDVWINTLSIVTRTWPSGERGDGDPEGTVLPITPNPEITELANDDVNASGGRYLPRRVRVRHITPYHPGPPAGGYTPEQLAPVFSDNATDVIYRITGPLAGDYSRVSLDRANPFEYVLTLVKLNQ